MTLVTVSVHFGVTPFPCAVDRRDCDGVHAHLPNGQSAPHSCGGEIGRLPVLVMVSDTMLQPEDAGRSAVPKPHHQVGQTVIKASLAGRWMGKLGNHNSRPQFNARRYWADHCVGRPYMEGSIPCTAPTDLVVAR